jgi:SRSO17 transposase
MSDKPKVLEGGAVGVERTPEERAERKVFSTKCGHLKRRIIANERLSGKVLEFALHVIPDDAICEKIKEGKKLTDYERHLIVDVWLLHLRLS